MPFVTAGGTIATGLLGKLASSGVQRLGSLAFQKIMRIVKIDAALKDASAKNKTVQIAINDFETVVGSRYGQLTEQLGQFLREIERSGVINLMVENALVGRSSIEVQKLFLEIHKKIIGIDQGDASLLYKKMARSFEVTLSELTKDKILLDAFRVHRVELEARLDKVDAALLSLIGEGDHSSGEISFKTQRATLLKIAKGLQGLYKSIRVETNKGPRTVDVTKIYIPPKLRYRDTDENSKKIGAIARFIKRRQKNKHDIPELFLADDGVTLSHPSHLSYQDLRLNFNRVVILGDPGGGKSTLCQHLCHDLAKQAVAALQGDSSQLNAQLQKLPLRIVLRAYEKARTANPQLSIYQFIVRDIQNHVVGEDGEIEDALKYLLTSGGAALAFDGLDEILATAQRREFVDLVVSFCNQFPLCPVIVTSRLVGYDNAPLAEDFDELILEKFDDAEVLQYVKKFMKVVGGSDEQEAGEKAGTFNRQTTSNASDLRRNPLMLGLMAWLFNMRGDVPSNRPEIYRECAVLMFEKWDPDRDIKANVPTNFDRLQLFSDVASKIFGNPELAAGVTDSWLEQEVRRFLEQVYENRAQAYAAAKTLVEFITGRAWVMSDVGDKVYAFTHQTFLEYFFARHIDDLYDKVSEVVKVIMPRVVQREWDMVSHLSLQIKTHRNLRRQNEAVDELRSAILKERNRKQKSALISFAARSLEYLAASESHVKPLVLEVMNHALGQSNKADSPAWGDVAQLLESCAERRDFIRETVVQFFVSAFKSDDIHLVNEVVVAVGEQEESSLHLANLQVVPPVLAARVRAELRPYVMERVEQSAFMAARAWEWYGNINKKLVSIHGVQTYFNSSPGKFGRLDGFCSMVLCASTSYSQHFSKLVDQKMGLEALATIGTVGFSTMPLPKRLFQTKLHSMPLHVWVEILNELKPYPAALAGGLFAMMLSTEVHDQQDEGRGPGRHARRKYIRNDVIEEYAASESLKGLALFPHIRKAVQGHTVLT